MKKTLLTGIICCCITIVSQAQWVSQNSGLTPGKGIVDIHAVDQNVVWAVPFDLSGTNSLQEFTKTTNGGTTWTTGQIPNAANHQVYTIMALDANTAWAGLTNETSGGAMIMKTTDGGATWSHQGSAGFSGADAYLNNIYFFNANEGIALGDPNGGYFEIYTTTNGGTTWTRVPQANIPANLNNEYGSIGFSVIGNTIWFATLEGRIYKSTNKGLNWTVASTPLSSISNVVFKDALNGIANDDDLLVRTTDGGTTWTSVSPTGNFRGLGLDFVPGANVYISTGFMGADAGSSYSMDNGQTWIELESNLTHTIVDFVDANNGWSGSVVSGADGIFRFNGNLTGLHNDQLNKSVSVFPNPSDGVFAVTLKDEQFKDAVFTVTDLTNRQVLQPVKANPESGETFINLSQLAKGVYMLQVKSGESISTRKLVLQ